MGGIVITNDGNCILREVDVSHPTAKSMIELSRAQDEEVGDGTTSVIILAGEMLINAEPFVRANIHPYSRGCLQWQDRYPSPDVAARLLCLWIDSIVALLPLIQWYWNVEEAIG